MPFSLSLLRYATRHPYSSRPCAVGALTLAMVAAPPLWADPVPALEQITVTATRTDVRLERLGGTTLDSAVIGRSLPYTALETLQQTTGITAFQKGGAGGNSYLSIRGGEPNYTLVLLDGVKLNDPANSQGGSFDFAQIDPAALSRIDIYRGALSAVHGADALSGVVNLQLRPLPADEQLLSAQLVADTEQGVGASGSIGAGWGEGSALLSASWADSGELTGLSTRERSQFIGRAMQALAGVQTQFTLLNSDNKRESFPEDSGGERLALNRELEQVDSELWIADLDFSRAEAGRVMPHLKLSWSEQQANTQTPAIFPGVLDPVPAINADTEFERLEVIADVALALSEVVSMNVGAGYLDERGDSRGDVDFGVLIPAAFAIDRDTSSLFAEITAAPDDSFSATFGVRYDDPSEQQEEWSPRLSLSYQPVSTLPALYANASQSYKLPSLYALAYPLIANPDLEPERSESVDAGLQQLLANGVRWRLGYFRTRYEDVIDFDNTLFTNVNRAWALAEGAEFELQWPLLSSLRLDLNATYMDMNAIDDVKLRSRPQWQAHATLDWALNAHWSAFASVHYSDDFYDSSIPTGLIEANGYTTIDTGISVQLSQPLTLSLALKNLLDEEYELSVGTPAPGRLARVAISYSM